MKTDDQNLKRVRELLEELNTLEDVQDILKNYDTEAYYYFVTYHNHNEKVRKEKKIPMNKAVKSKVISDTKQRIEEIKEELEKL